MTQCKWCNLPAKWKIYVVYYDSASVNYGYYCDECSKIEIKALKKNRLKWRIAYYIDVIPERVTFT